MKALEPHPMLPLPTQEVALRIGKHAMETVLTRRLEAMEKEKYDPYVYGYIPPIWRVVDELLEDGKEVVLADPAWDMDDKELRKIRPPDFLREAVRRRVLGLGPLTVTGRSEILITGSNRSSKSEYAGRKVIEILDANDEARTWSYADTESISIARQQPLLYKYAPAEIRLNTQVPGAKLGPIMKFGYKQGTGFAGQTFVFPNKAQHWFKNYKQSIGDVEGDQLDMIWMDELRDPELLKTLRVRVGDRGGLIIVTFTSIDDNYTTILDEYRVGAKTVFEVDAELLPILDQARQPTGRFEKVPRVEIAGPGSDGNQRANIVYFHITDNPYYGFSGKVKPGEKAVFGAKRFFPMWKGASREKILSRVYGILVRSRRQKFPKVNGAIHMIQYERIPMEGTNYHVVDPCPGRNWAMTWWRITQAGFIYIYREWPSYGHQQPSAYVQGIGSPGPWATKGKPLDGVPGAAQIPFGLGLDRYKQEILRMEGREPSPTAEAAPLGGGVDLGGDKVQRFAPRNPLVRRRGAADPAPGAGEKIESRWMDSRYHSQPQQTVEGSTTVQEQMSKLGMEFLAASGKAIEEGTVLINNALDYDDEIPIGEYSPRLARINGPRLFVADTCPNVWFALKEWTGEDGQKGACKDFVDNLRYGFLADLQFVGEEVFAWQGGGSY